MSIYTIPIREILDFWFGSDGIDGSYENYNKNKEKYQKYWFDGSMDSFIVEKYNDLLIQLSRKEDLYNEWVKTVDGKIATIIVLDQFSRSIDRYNHIKNNNDRACNEMAYALATEMLAKGEDLNIPLIYRIFMLMPYRHRDDSNSLDIVLQKIEEYKNCTEENTEENILDRFRYATYQNYTNLKDRIWEYINNNKSRNNDDILDENCVINRKNFTRLSDIPDIRNDALFLTMKSFFTDKNKNIDNIQNIHNIGISLSGGVDSMVILFLLSLLRDFGYIKSVVAVHIEYSADEYTKKETDMMGEFCDIIAVPLIVRTISYMERDEIDRDFYEAETRKVRFHTYRCVSERYNLSGFCLGHHRGDLSENVMMNVLNGRDILDLSVMEKDTTQHNVRLFRPLLDRKKSEIFEIARKYHIPYLKDTTPDWSCRGVFRRKMVPVMEEQWGDQVLERLIDLGRQSNEWNQVMETFVLGPIKKGIVFKDDKDEHKITIPIQSDSHQLPKVIWMRIFLHVFHTVGKKMISRKNIEYFHSTFRIHHHNHHHFNFSNGCVGTFFENRLEIKL